MNSSTFIGRLGADPKITNTKEHKIAQFVVAVPKSKDEADWFRVVAWDKTAEIVEKFCKKGKQVGCSGSLHTRCYEDKKTKEKTYTWEIIIHTLDLLGDSNQKEEAVPDEMPLPF